MEERKLRLITAAASRHGMIFTTHKDRCFDECFTHDWCTSNLTLWFKDRNEIVHSLTEYQIDKRRNYEGARLRA
jgi:hypothetical protein